MCQCRFSKNNVDEESFAACNDQFSEYVTFRARLSGTSDNDSELLIFLLTKWVSTSPTIFVSGLQMNIANNELNCTTLLSGHDDPDCVSELKKAQKKDINAIIIGIIIPVVGIIIVSAATIVAAVLTGKDTDNSVD